MLWLLIIFAGTLPAGANRHVRCECFLRSDSGACLARFDSFYFDVNLGRCRRFTYGGCGGNENRFNSLEECQNVCSSTYGMLQRFPEETMNLCNGMFQQRPCDAQPIGYDARGRCKVSGVGFKRAAPTSGVARRAARQPKYCMQSGGCALMQACPLIVLFLPAAWPNVFDSLQSCQQQCQPWIVIIGGGWQQPQLTTLPPPPPPMTFSVDCACLLQINDRVKVLYGATTPFSFCMFAGECLPVSEMKHNENKFASKVECRNACTKTYEYWKADTTHFLLAGLCEPYLSHHRCEVFSAPSGPMCAWPDKKVKTYYRHHNGVCKPVERCNYFRVAHLDHFNLFGSQRECAAKCGVDETWPEPESTSEPVPTGEPTPEPESTPEPSMTYSPPDPSPEPSTSAEPDKDGDPCDCLLQADVGDCGPNVPDEQIPFCQRFYYNANTDQCAPFTYTGCAGNGNNFVTMYACQKQCNGARLPQCKDEHKLSKWPCKVQPCKPAYLNYEFFYNAMTGQCMSHELSNMVLTKWCHTAAMQHIGNINQFDEDIDCENKCIP